MPITSIMMNTMEITMRKLLANLLTISATVLFVLVGSVTHAAAASSMMPDGAMGSMDHHSMSGGQKCATLCAMSIAKREDSVQIKIVEDDNDRQPSTPYYLAFFHDTAWLSEMYSAQAVALKKLEPPPETPDHVTLSVIRV